MISSAQASTPASQPEEFIRALASRYGFRDHDYCLIWDDGEFENSRAEHDVRVVTADGRSFATHLGVGAIEHFDAWKYLQSFDSAFMALARRDTRGV